jgi:hypothetical protein
MTNFKVCMIRTPFTCKLLEFIKLRNCIKYMPIMFKIGIPYPRHNIKKILGFMCLWKNFYSFLVSASTVDRYSG